LGIKCVWEGNSSRHKNEKVIELAKKEILIPVCPEQLGGLPTPREPAELKDKRVVTKSGKDITDFCVRGAEETLKIAQLLGIKEAVFRKFSPSCGSGKVYDGSFTGATTKGDGIATTLLKKYGIKVISEEEL